MADTHLPVPIRSGAIQRLVVTLAADLTGDPDATLTLISGGTVTLYDASGAVAELVVDTPYIEDEPISGFDETDAATVRAWYLLETSTLAAGSYVLAFTLEAIGSDGEVSTFRPTVGVEIQAAAADFTYDEPSLGLATAAGRLAGTRLLLTDTVNRDDQPRIYSDSEIRFFLAEAVDDQYIAAALGYEAWVRSQGRLAQLMSRGGFQTARHALTSLMEAAKSLRRSRRVTSGTVLLDSPRQYAPALADSVLAEENL